MLCQCDGSSDVSHRPHDAENGNLHQGKRACQLPDFVGIPMPRFARHPERSWQLRAERRVVIADPQTKREKRIRTMIMLPPALRLRSDKACHEPVEGSMSSLRSARANLKGKE